MSGNHRSMDRAMARLVDKIKRTVSTDQDDTKDPQNHGYRRVHSGGADTSTSGTSLEAVAIDSSSFISPTSTTTTTTATDSTSQIERAFSPLIEIDDTNQQSQPQQSQQPQPIQQFKLQPPQKSSIKGSKVSFQDDKFSSDEDDFSDRRDQFQQRKTKSTADHKSIFKDLKHLLENDNRKQFQSKKHVSLDVKHSKLLEDILKGSSSEEEFQETRKQFQSRKHQSLDARVTFKLDKEPSTSTTSSDEEVDGDNKRLIHFHRDITKPIVIDLKDLESSEDEDFISTRNTFQQQRQISTDSRKSLRFFEMDDMNKKDSNLRNSVPFVRQITQDGKPKLEVYRPTTNPIYIYTQVLAALSVSLGSMVVGFSSAYTSPALVSMTDGNITSFEMTKQSASWVGGVMPLAGLVGGIAGGPLIETLGRKNTILATAIPFIVSWLLIACANAVWLVLVGRGLSGFCVGIASLSLPVYLGETVQPEVRGTLGLLPTAFGNIGILVCFVAGTYMDWSGLAFLGGALPIPFLILMFLIPETPRWYVSRGKEEQARKALQWLRGRDADVEPELKGVIKSHSDAERHASKNALFDLLKRNNLKPLSISLGLMFFQQLSGINAVIFYTVQIFQDAGSTIDENLCTIIVGVVNFASTFVATMLIDRLGRKMLLYISDVAMIITLFTLGAFFYLKTHGSDVSNVGWLPLGCFVVYVVGFSLGFGPIPWLMMGEILPGKIRGSAASVATAFNWACTFVVTKTFNDLISSIGTHGTFWFFGSFCFVGLFFVIFCVPETQGKTLEDIERKMMGRVRRMSSVANMKPLSFNM